MWKSKGWSHAARQKVQPRGYTVCGCCTGGWVYDDRLATSPRCKCGAVWRPASTGWKASDFPPLLAATVAEAPVAAAAQADAFQCLRKLLGDEAVEAMALAFPALEALRPAKKAEPAPERKSLKVAAAAKALRVATAANDAAWLKKSQIEEKIVRWELSMAKARKELVDAEEATSETKADQQAKEAAYTAANAETPTQAAKEEEPPPEQKDEAMEETPPPEMPEECSAFVLTLEPDKRKLLQDHLASVSVWHEVAGKRRKKLKLTADEEKKEAESLRVTAGLFAAAAAHAAARETPL
jgi:hypothetical protein